MKFLRLLPILIPAISFAQEQKIFLPCGDSIALQDAVISAVRFPEKTKNIVQKIDIISSFRPHVLSSTN